MKKHDEGYVMLLVVVVILVLSIVSASLMSMTVANLKNQRNSVNRMKEKYSAQDELEKEIAILGQKGEDIPLSNVVVPEDEVSQTKQEVDDLAKWLKETYNIEPQEIKISTAKETITVFEGTANEEEKEILVCKSFSYTVSGSVQHETTRIDYGVKVSGNFMPCETGQGSMENQDSENKTKYDLTVTGVDYTDYEITTISEGGGG